MDTRNRYIGIKLSAGDKESSLCHHRTKSFARHRDGGAMTSVAQMAQILTEVLEDEANRLGRESGWQQRQRALSGADFVQTLLFGWWQDPKISLDGLTQVAGRRQVQISASGLHQRFTPQAAQLLF